MEHLGERSLQEGVVMHPEIELGECHFICGVPASGDRADHTRCYFIDLCWRVVVLLLFTLL